MDDLAFAASSDISRRACRLLANHQDCLRRSRERLALSHKLLAQPIYPYDHVPPHNPFDFTELRAKAGE